ncbi:MAG: hypothetical protein IJJ21_03425 [Firmicutes bacterium]|nr:hypothetical protein [Bacillota bacterium]
MKQDYIYCIYCDTMKTDTIARLIEEVLQVRCISPKIVQRYWKKGECTHRVHDYLPGYLFMYAEEPVPSVRDVLRFPGVHRVLGEQEDGHVLSGADLAFARMLSDMDGTLGIMKALQEGDKVHLADGLYHGFSGEILKLDRRKGRAQIRFTFDGSIQNVWVGYDLIKPDEAQPEKAQEEAKEA